MGSGATCLAQGGSRLWRSKFTAARDRMSQFWVNFGTKFWSRFGLGWEIPKNVWHFLAHNFVVHLSGWARLEDTATACPPFAPKLRNWVPSRKTPEKIQKN